MLVIDISMINATLGRASGDELLKEIAKRLSDNFRRSDDITRLTLSRIGGDVFAVLVPELANKEAVTWMVNRLMDSLAETVDIDGNSIFMTGHVGVSLYPSDANSVDELINNAMTAKKFCKQIKTAAGFQFFDNHMQDLSIKHLNLDKELRNGIQNQEWELFYQPKMNINTGAIVGA